MSENTGEFRIDPLAAELSRLRPRGVQVDRDQLLYRAGAAHAERLWRRRSRNWSLACLALLIVNAASLSTLIPRGSSPRHVSIAAIEPVANPTIPTNKPKVATADRSSPTPAGVSNSPLEDRPDEMPTNFPRTETILAVFAANNDSLAATDPMSNLVLRDRLLRRGFSISPEHLPRPESVKPKAWSYGDLMLRGVQDL